MMDKTLNIKALEQINSRWKSWPYKNTFFLLVSLAVFFYFADSVFVRNMIDRIGNMGYFGSFITGIFFVYTFTVAPAVVVLYHLADTLNPLGVALLAGLGAVVGDYIIFRFMRNKVFKELKPLFEKFGGSTLRKIFFTPYFAWLIPFAGIFIIASPIPDEVGISMLGASKIKNWQFLLLAFILNALGIFVVVTIARSF